MGCDGGIRIISMDEIRKNLKTISEKINEHNIERITKLKNHLEISLSKGEDAHHDWWNKPDYLKGCIEHIQETIDSMSYGNLKELKDEDLIDKLREGFGNCDTPYYHKGDVIVASGDNVYDEFQNLYACCDGIYIETWT